MKFKLQCPYVILLEAHQACLSSMVCSRLCTRRAELNSFKRDPAAPRMSYPKKTTIQKDTGTPMLTAALFTIARTWKPPRHPLTDEWIKKMWNLYTMGYYSAIKRNTSASVLVR